jgi:hypothetical protein
VQTLKILGGMIADAHGGQDVRPGSFTAVVRLFSAQENGRFSITGATISRSSMAGSPLQCNMAVRP